MLLGFTRTSASTTVPMRPPAFVQRFVTGEKGFFRKIRYTRYSLCLPLPSPSPHTPRAQPYGATRLSHHSRAVVQAFGFLPPAAQGEVPFPETVVRDMDGSRTGISDLENEETHSSGGTPESYCPKEYLRSAIRTQTGGLGLGNRGAGGGGGR